MCFTLTKVPKLTVHYWCKSTVIDSAARSQHSFLRELRPHSRLRHAYLLYLLYWYKSTVTDAAARSQRCSASCALTACCCMPIYFTCFTGTKVPSLTLRLALSGAPRASPSQPAAACICCGCAGAGELTNLHVFTCFTASKASIYLLCSTASICVLYCKSCFTASPGCRRSRVRSLAVCACFTGTKVQTQTQQLRCSTSVRRGAGSGTLRSVYWLYWYKSTNTDAEWLQHTCEGAARGGGERCGGWRGGGGSRSEGMGGVGGGGGGGGGAEQVHMPAQVVALLLLMQYLIYYICRGDGRWVRSGSCRGLFWETLILL
jgi:uncharacterized membrane protein YgcG